jgi:hypothetical protein
MLLLHVALLHCYTLKLNLLLTCYTLRCYTANRCAATYTVLFLINTLALPLLLNAIGLTWCVWHGIDACVWA